MKNLGKDIIAVIGTLVIIVVAFLLLSYGRKNEVSAILMFGTILDALVTAGVIGNAIVFLLVKITRFNSLKAAFWTLLMVNGLLFAMAAIIGSKADPTFGLGKLAVGYVVSFVFWFGLHWLWAQKNNSIPSTT